MIYVCEKESGRIIQVVDAPDSHGVHYAGDDIEINVLEYPVDPNTFYFINGSPVSISPAPSRHHAWNWSSKSWLPDLDAARASKLQQVSAELNTRLYLPCNGFDADTVSRGRISGMVARLQRGDGLPPGWVGWRDASNDMQWAADDAATVLTSLTALSRAIENREQALLIAAWQHKANIAALEDIDAILAYDVTQGWPT